MKRILWILLSLPLMATDSINFIDLIVERGENRLTLRTESQELMPYELLRDEEYDIDKNIQDNTLDAPFRQTAYLMRTLERNRGTIYKNPSAPLPVLSFRFELALREADGDEIEMVEYKTFVGLHPEEGMGVITLENMPSVAYKFNINELNGPEAYRNFVNHLAFPFEERTFALPGQDEFLVDLYFQWPEVEVSEKDFNVFDLFPSLILWDRGIIRKLKIHLGTTYCFKESGEWKQVRSAHLRAFKQSIDTYTRVLQLIKEGDVNTIIPALEEYVALVPGNRKALKKLMDYYLKDQRNDEAYNLISRFQPFFATIRGGLPNQKALALKAERRRNWLLGIKNSFHKDEDITLAITSPADGDLVTGTTDLTFSLAGNDSPILEVECYLDEQLIVKLTGPPFKVPFTVDGSFGDLTLRVVAYFENETFQEDTLRVKTLRVDQQTQVNLVAVRASVFQSKGELGRELTKSDFRITENKAAKEIENFKKDTAPLRVAILLDTSISMFGRKLYRAQYAVKTFLEKLAPEDRVSIYSFDTRVLKLSDFTNEYSKVTPLLMTLSPQGATSLYDAMLIAHDALIGQNGTKVMIVISDGDDSNSAVNDIHVAGLLRNSPVMVYSVILPGGVLGDSAAGDNFLREMARLSGSMSIRLSNTDKLDETFERLYQDLKSFYYLDYYSDITDPDKRDLRVKVVGTSGKIRFRAIN